MLSVHGKIIYMRENGHKQSSIPAYALNVIASAQGSIFTMFLYNKNVVDCFWTTLEMPSLHSQWEIEFTINRFVPRETLPSSISTPLTPMEKTVMFLAQ